MLLSTKKINNYLAYLLLSDIDKYILQYFFFFS